MDRKAGDNSGGFAWNFENNFGPLEGGGRGGLGSRAVSIGVHVRSSARRWPWFASPPTAAQPLRGSFGINEIIAVDFLDRICSRRRNADVVVNHQLGELLTVD